ncbi:MAG TPA: glycosyltransferase family 2 protein [Acidobacteriaceae bacterium]|nr:glycosyltransferase family 2 protein [Acidobacteriaceae bacterium]
MRRTLSVAIITLDEEANLPRTLASIAWVDQIVVVDAGSTDQTVAVARNAGARVFPESWKGFAAQKNSAISHCTGDWILSLDADEEVSSALSAEIQTLLAGDPTCDAYNLPRSNFFLGRPLRYGGFHPDRKLRLFRRGAARFSDRAVHETLSCSGEIGQLHNGLLHHAYPTLTSYIDHMNCYSTLGAEILVQRGRCSRSFAAFVWNVIAVPQLSFFYNYVVRFGFLDGREGLLMHLYQANYTSWKYAKAWHSAK